MYVRTHTHPHMCIYKFLYIYMHACIYAYMYIFIQSQFAASFTVENGYSAYL